jgi:hypothetical protein
MIGFDSAHRTFFTSFSAIFAILFQSDYNSFAKLLLFCEIGTIIGYKFTATEHLTEHLTEHVQ